MHIANVQHIIPFIWRTVTMASRGRRNACSYTDQQYNFKASPKVKKSNNTTMPATQDHDV